MKKLLTLILFACLSLPAFGQLGNVTLLPFLGAPTGACAQTQVAVNLSTNHFYVCPNGSWVDIGPGAAGSAVWSTLTPGTNSTAGSFIASGNTWDFTAATFLLPHTAVTPGSYTAANVTIGADGRITAASNGSGGGGNVSNSGTPASPQFAQWVDATHIQGVTLTLPANTTATSHQFFTAYTSSSGAFTKGQPACADVSDATVLCSTAPGTGVAAWLGTPTVTNLGTALGSQSQHFFLAAPSGAAGNVAARAIVASDIPTLNQSTTGNSATATALASTPTQCTSGQFSTGITANGNANCGTPAGGGNVSNSGTPTSGQAAEWVSSTAVQGVSTAGGGTQYIKATIASPAQGDVMTFDSTPKLVNRKPGIAVDAQSSATPSVTDPTDRAALLETTNGTTSTATSVPSAASLGSNFPFVTCNLGSVINTVTPTTSTVNGNATQKLVGEVSGHNPECAFWWSDNTNYFSAEILPTDANGLLADEGLPNTGVSAGSCGDATHSCSLTIDVKGRITAQSNNAISGASGLSGMTAGQVPIAATATTVTSSKALSGAGSGIVTGPTISTNTDLVSYSGTAGQTQDSGIASGNITQTTATPAANQICVYGSTAKTCTPTTTLPTAAEPAHTGDVTNSPGSLAMTVNKISGTSPGTNAVAAFGVSDTTFTNATTAITANSCSASAVTVTMTGVTTSMAFVISPSTDVSGSTGWGSSGGLVIDAWPTANTLNYKICNQTASSITPAAVTWNVGVR